MLPQQINTIAELQAQQRRLLTNMRRTRQEFVRSAGKTSNGTKDFLLKNILLPAGAIGLGVFVAKQISGHHYSGSEEAALQSNIEAGRAHESEKGSGWFAKLMLMAWPYVQQLFLKNEAEDANEQADSSQNNNLAPLGWLAPVVPIAMSLLQQFFLKKEEASKEQTVTFDENGHEVLKAAPKQGSAAIFGHMYKLLPIVLPLALQYFAAGKQPVREEATA